jgi:hypothetical protein
MPKPIGARAGRSTAPASAICNSRVSLDCLYGGRSKTTTPSDRCPGPSRRLLNRKSVTGNCSAVDQRECLMILPDFVFPPSCTCGGMSRILCSVGFTTENSTTTCWPPSMTSLTPARTWSPEGFSTLMCSP